MRATTRALTMRGSSAAWRDEKFLGLPARAFPAAGKRRADRLLFHRELLAGAGRHLAGREPGDLVALRARLPGAAADVLSPARARRAQRLRAGPGRSPAAGALARAGDP